MDSGIELTTSSTSPNIQKNRKGKTVTFTVNELINISDASQISRTQYGNSILDAKTSHILNFPLTVKQQLWLFFLIPALIQTIIYILDLGTDVAIGIALINERHLISGIITLLIVYTPPLVCLAVRLLKPPQSRNCKVITIWLVIEFSAFLIFPLRPIFCFAERIFLGIESLRLEDPEREQILEDYEQTKNPITETYLFLQAYVQALPQAVLQLTLIALRISSNSQTEEMQALSVICSLATVALSTCEYHRYMSQVKGGRKNVWSSLSNSSSSNETTIDPLINHNIEQIRFSLNTKSSKVMEEDNPAGKTLLFNGWFLFLMSRTFCFAAAAYWFPYIVLGICVIHYILGFIYILPTNGFRANNILMKFLLPFIYIFCLIEVGFQFNKPNLLLGLFFSISSIEELVVTILWILGAKWHGHLWYYLLIFLGVSWSSALLCFFFYIKWFLPPTKRLRISN